MRIESELGKYCVWSFQMFSGSDCKLCHCLAIAVEGIHKTGSALKWKLSVFLKDKSSHHLLLYFLRKMFWAKFLFRCPECGRTPPGQKKSESFRKMIGRKLSVRKSVSFKSSSSNRSREARELREVREVGRHYYYYYYYY